ncbi:uncharacterized protein NECHADRAFT_34809 [Fusarium vanettenii 77-13-4]|uniref:Tse2 ADP-ribosyltransferase toxin domain-containing protein n=1 Tax=Fusarium vanettenii (strain ATCC MYA-4622 / CBS 123669 / FGSC 9596 / NRRL 45880 / 77-13-4) TaxID=660122 RepID=C7ZMY0_FUSV7|nr:uncharacterized protein NECHADRAFT_34809 [Fusarium vanettenii 77-13-4]EEU34662.1 hypothetical protein NECHADRAFT_34809 [Fusarium vanettenii 77-13-4]
MSTSNLISLFKKFPKELFRVNNDPLVKLRVLRPNRHIYDIVLQNGLALPKALNPSSYIAPNGASLRPNSQYQQSLVSWRFRGNDTIVYSVPEGTTLPDNLLLVHERSDHYSLQPAMAMTTKLLHLDLNTKITQFLMNNAMVFAREEWLEVYPKATETSESKGRRT